MDYEKKYKEALAHAREIHRNEEEKRKDMEWLFPELKETEDERIRKELITHCRNTRCVTEEGAEQIATWIAWLEKQGETINRNEFAQGVLRGAAINLITWIDYNAAEGNTCLSNVQCKEIGNALVRGDWDKIYRYIKSKLEKQGEQMKTPEESLDISSDKWNDIVDRCLFDETNGKTAMEAIKEVKVDNAIKVESKPKFKVGDWVVCEVTGSVYQIKNCIENLSNHKYGYDLTNGGYIGSDEVNHYHLWTIADAKDGDVLVYGDNPADHHVEVIMIFKSLRNEESAFTHFHIFDDTFRIDDWSDCNKNAHPATKEQCDTLFAKMREAGYKWDAEKKELKKIEKQGEKEEVYSNKTNSKHQDIMQMLQSIYEVLVSINNKATVQIIPHTPQPLEPFYDTSKPYCNTTNKIDDEKSETNM